MPSIHFTYALKRFFPELKPQDIDKDSLPEILAELEKRYPGLRSYIVDDQGALRQHVNIFLDGKLVKDRKSLNDSLQDVKEIHFMQALSGG